MHRKPNVYFQCGRDRLGLWVGKLAWNFNVFWFVFFFRGMCYTGALSLGHDLLLAGRSDVRSVFSIDLAI